MLQEKIELQSRQLNLMLIGASKIVPLCRSNQVSMDDADLIGFFKFVRFYSGKLSFRIL